MIQIALATGLFVAFVLALSALVLGARRLLIPQGAITVTVNGTRQVPVPPGATLLDALSAQGIGLPASCGGKGTCGLCRVTLTQGGGPVLPTEAARLSPSELRAGMRLACQVRLHEPADLQLPPALLDTRPFQATVTETRPLTPTIRQITLALPPGQDFPFRPGDFALVTAPPFRQRLDQIDMAPLPRPAWAEGTLQAASTTPVTRAYSIANRPQDTGSVTLMIRLALPPPDRPDIPPGRVSSWLFARQPGDAVSLSGPFGDFHAHPGKAEMVFVGGGVGMAPLRAMIHAELAQDSQRQVSFFYGARTLADLIHTAEFQALADRHPRFRWVPVLSETPDGGDWTGATGFVHDTLGAQHLDTHPAPESCEYYLCGPPLMIRAVTAALANAGVDRDTIFFDDFGA